jgi:hypothetical protein
MNAARPIPLTLAALSCAFLLPVAIGACGAEAPAPVPGNGTAGSSVLPMGGTPGSGGTGTGTSGTPAAGGTGVSATGGATAGTAPTGGTGTTTTAGTSAGGSSTAGTSTSGGTSAAGTSTGGGSGGAAGSVGSGDPLATVPQGLNGFMLLGPCLADSAGSVCQTVNGACPGEKADHALSGVLTTDKTIKLGGDPAKVYSLTLHIQGVVESKRYDGGKDAEGQLTSPKANGFCEGGTPTHGDAYNVYMIRVGTPKKDYFLNSLQTPGVSNHTTYGIDYTATIQANGGSDVRLVAADSNCSMIKNCGPTVNDGSVCAQPIVLASVDPGAGKSADNMFKTYDFTKNYPETGHKDGQWVSIVVTAVTAN